MHPDSGGPAPHHGGGGRARHARPRRSPGAVAAVAALMAALLPGCADPPDDARPAGSGAPIEVTDGVGRTVRLQAPARRVVSMLPALTDWLVAMGVGDRLVARTDYDTDPSLAHLPTVGGGLDPSVEWLAARRPDLVLAWPDAPSRSLVQRLEALDIAVYTAPIQSIEEALRAARDLGRLLGDTAAAASAIREVRAGLDSVRSAVGDRPSPSVLFLIGTDPLMAAGPGTFLHELVAWAGGRNAIADVPILWPQLSLEQVILRAPDVIIIGSLGPADPATALAGRPGWRDVPAVRAGRVHAVHPDTVNRPGPALDDAAALLARLIHGAPAGAARP